MTFNEILETLPTIEHLNGINIKDNQTIIHHIPAQAGKFGSLRVYHALASEFSKLNKQSAEKGLMLFAEHTKDAQENPNKHPNIDLLFKVITEGLDYQIEILLKDQ